MRLSRPSITLTRVLAVVGTYYVARSVWRSIPKWMKRKSEDEEGEDGTRGLFKDANDDLSSSTAIMAKLNEMFNLTYKHCDDLLPDDMPQYKLYVCLVSFLHLLAELHSVHPEWRDEDRRQEGESVSVDVMHNLAFYLELAHDAYKTSVTEVIVKLRPLGYEIIRHDVATEPGRVGHFIAVSHEKKEIVIAIKGTSSLSDVMTDLIGAAVPHELSSGRVIRCHEGIYTAAKMMLDDTEHLIKTFFQPAGYTVHLCGHSLGAGVSSLLGVFLHERGTPVTVHAFATPACLSLDASMECQDYITSVVNNADCVPRLSLVNIRTLNKLFLKIDEKLNDRGLSPNDWTSTGAYLKDIATIDTDLLMSPEELHNFQQEAYLAEDGNDDYSLFVPGRVISMWNCNTIAVPEENLIVDCKQLHGGMQTLRQIEISTCMISDHSCDNYKATLKAMIVQAEGAISSQKTSE